MINQVYWYELQHCHRISSYTGAGNLNPDGLCSNTCASNNYSNRVSAPSEVLSGIKQSLPLFIFSSLLTIITS